MAEKPSSKSALLEEEWEAVGRIDRVCTQLVSPDAYTGSCIDRTAPAGFSATALIYHQNPPTTSGAAAPVNSNMVFTGLRFALCSIPTIAPVERITHVRRLLLRLQ